MRIGICAHERGNSHALAANFLNDITQNGETGDNRHLVVRIRR